MSEYYAISRIENYKYSDCGGVFKEALRILPNYDNPNCDSSRSYLNVSLVDNNIKNVEKYILKYREDNNIKGRFNTVGKNPKTLTNVMSQALFTMSNDYINALSRDEQIEFFKYCLEFFKSEFPEVPILAANIHFDENTPHLHVTFIPVCSRVNKKTGEVENIFSTTLLMPGRDFFPQYQDRFYHFISKKYEGLTRSSSSRKNLTPEEYRKVAPILEEYENEISQLKNKVNRLQAILNVPIVKRLVEAVFSRGEKRATAIADIIKQLEIVKNNSRSPIEKSVDSLEDKINAANIIKNKVSTLKDGLSNVVKKYYKDR